VKSGAETKSKRFASSVSRPSEPCAIAGSKRRLSSPFVKSPPTLLAANRLVRVRRVSRAVRTARRHDGGFALEGQVWILSLGLVFDVG
jgi:hypothetical protein